MNTYVNNIYITTTATNQTPEFVVLPETSNERKPIGKKKKVKKRVNEFKIEDNEHEEEKKSCGSMVLKESDAALSMHGSIY